MDFYEETVEEPVKPPRQRGSDAGWNILTVLCLLGALCLGGSGLYIFMNPESPYNPYPPLTLPPTIVIPSATPTPLETSTFTATATVPSPTATFTLTPAPTDTEMPTQSSTEEGTPSTPLELVTPSLTADANMPFVVQEGNPLAMTSAAQHPEVGCDWMGVGGQVFNKEGAPAVGYMIMVGGMLNGKTVNMVTLSGTYTNYGPAGYEFKLSDTPITSSQEVWIQIFDQSRLPLSKPVYLDTYNDCNRNLIMVNFKQIK